MSRLKRRQLAAFIAGICFSVFGSPHADLALPQTTDEQRLRALTQEFLTVYSKKDLEAFTRFWSEKSPELAARSRVIARLFAASDKIEVREVAIRRLDVDGNNAKLRVTVEINATDAKTGKLAAGYGKMNRAMEFVKETGGWKVWRDIPAEEVLADALLAASSEQERSSLTAAEPELVNDTLLRSIFERGVRLRIAGKYDEALSAYSYLRGIAERTGNTNALASAVNGAAVVYDLRGDHSLALKLFQESLTIREAIGDKALIAGSLLNVGGAYRWLGDYDKALDYYERSLRLGESIGDPTVTSRAYNNAGIIYDLRGNYTSAIQAYQKSLEIKRKVGDKIGVAQTLNNLAVIYRLQGSVELALTLNQESLTLRREAGDKAGVSESLLSIGNVYHQQSDAAAALDYYHKSLQLSQEIGEKNRAALTLSNIGGIHTSRGEFPQASETIRKSVDISKSLENKEYLAYALIQMARLHLAQRDYALARDTAEQAIAIARPVGLLDSLREMYSLAGQAYRGLNQPGEARRSFDDAIAIIETLRSQIAGGEQEQQGFFEERVSPYYAMIELLVAQSNMSEALAYAERAKGRALLDVLRSGRVSVTKTMTAEEQERERALIREIVSLNSQISHGDLSAQPDRITGLKSRLEKARLNYEAFQTGLYAVHPKLKAQRVQTPPLNLAQTSDLLDSKTALLEYVVAEEKTFLFVLTGNSSAPALKRLPEPVLTVYEININRKELAERVERFRRRLANRDRDFHQPAADLYALLIKPARVHLQDKTKLVIVPDDALWNLPFQALQSKEDRYLIEDSAISYAPSLTVLREMTNARKKETNVASASRPLLAMGNPAMGQQTIARVKSLLTGETLEPLPEAERQVKTVARLYGATSRVYVGPEAREDLFKSEVGKYRVLHLATHGMLNDVSPMYSYVLLSQTEGSEDGMLEAWEMIKLDLNADLVVLSACDTARGHVGAGEGVIGTTWALFVAGCPTLVVSQWKVESASTTDLMVEFHRFLKSGRFTTAEALRQAELKLLRSQRYGHPFFWAGFVVVGVGL